MSLSLMLKHTVLGRILMLLGIGAIFVLIFEFWAFSYKTRVDAANENNQQITQSINALRADIVSRNALYNRLTEHDMFWVKQHFSGDWQVQLPDLFLHGHFLHQCVDESIHVLRRFLCLYTGAPH